MEHNQDPRNVFKGAERRRSKENERRGCAEGAKQTKKGMAANTEELAVLCALECKRQRVPYIGYPHQSVYIFPSQSRAQLFSA
jgi:hypothetical protein